MLLRSSSTPFLPSSSPPSLPLRRAVSDSHLPSLHPSPSDAPTENTTTTTTLHTELSFSIYTKLQEQEEHHPTIHHQPPRPQEQPELPLFLARGLGIDRIASGLFAAGKKAGVVKGSMAGGDRERGGEGEMASEQDREVMELDAQYKKMVDEEPSNALFLRNYAQFLHQVKGDSKRAEEYYSRAVLCDPSDGEIMSQYAKLLWEVHHDQERSINYFHKSVQAAPHNSYVLAAYASFLWELDDDSEEGEQDTGAAPGCTAEPVQHRELASATV